MSLFFKLAVLLTYLLSDTFFEAFITSYLSAQFLLDTSESMHRNLITLISDRLVTEVFELFWPLSYTI